MTPDGLAIRDALERECAVTDEAFDALYPSALRDRSELNWTPVAIAARAAALFELGPEHRVLDVGCGVGKACLVATLASRGPVWWGVERDPALVESARDAARALGIETRFLCCEAWELDWARFDGLYFFNPFPLPPTDHPNAFVRYGAFVQHVCRAEERLARLPIGMRVVTYHGFGGDMPDGYTLIAREPAGTDELQLWVRTR